MDDSINRRASNKTRKPANTSKPESALKLDSTLRINAFKSSGSASSKSKSSARPQSSSKPQSTSKPYSASKSQTPKLNDTTASMRSSSPFMSGIKPLQSNNNLNCTIFAPTIKRALIAKPTVNQDRELEVKLVYNDYLQANFQKYLLEEALTRQKQDFKEQIFLQNERNYKRKVELIQTKEQLNELELLEGVGTILQQLLSTQEKFIEICQNTNLEPQLRKLVSILTKMNSRVYTNGVSPMKTEKDYEELLVLMSKSALACKNSKPSSLTEVNNLAVLIKSLQESVDNFKQEQNMFQATHKTQTSKLLKALSDSYANKGKYNKDSSTRALEDQ